MIIFYDASCPLCNAEMQQLKTADIEEKIVLEDLNAEDFSARFPDINKEQAMATLHAQTLSGEIIYGLDVTHQAWALVGKHRWLKILRWPIVRYFADAGYTFFAKYRQPISRFLMPNTSCNGNSCNPANSNKK
ncbi:MAG: putative DCC family thiol-disulfide oxidoreductase YuxK [Oleispira sp.]|jgi:predicted DCC family thiol-disulfide oxidoreductase YuxK